MSRTVLVTGAASGIGAAAARAFGALGDAVGCIDRADARDVVAAIEAEGGRACAAAADVADPAAVDAAAAKLERALGPASTAVLAAGVKAGPTPVADLEPAEWERVVRVNLTGVFVAMRAAIAQARRAGGGSITVVASAAGLGAGPGYAAYYASKHGTIGLMRAAANELAGDGIRVNAVCPGWVDTPMFDAEVVELGFDRDEAIRELTGDHLIQRLIEPREIADAIIWLASERAAMVTGIALPIDGGLLAGSFTK